MTTAAQPTVPCEAPDEFDAWLRKVARPIGNCETADGRVLEMFETKQRIGGVPPGSPLSRRTIACVFRAERGAGGY